MTTFFKNFLKCGLLGWSVEILASATDALRRRQMHLLGTTSLWMFPIYGSAALLTPICRLLRGKSIWLRGLSYMTLIFSAEYLTGNLLEKYSLRPWSYAKARWNVKESIRLDFAPAWFALGLLFERILLPPAREHDSL